ncbi:hypothetical protein FAES_1805 [Fibrella aestuarina BUZ 2]|uniref:Uncharacterized protein n=1 Tax=Fibrella aestuarina BUZ 2 TaxID=1166018 RepID=I0K6R2_9BACT|nr:hypothetical protein [Fibrella aestuarina]CCG99815.1 hypothetical protein FAES_1805 [Fibrella aestuarina BUZ 2]
MAYQPKCRYVAGIDPDIDKSGLVIYDRDERRWLCLTIPVAELREKILGFSALDIEIIVEAGWLVGGFHHMAGMPANLRSRGVNAQLAYVGEACTRVGQNFGVGKTIVALLQAEGYEVKLVTPPKPPRRKPGEPKVKMKWDAEKFMHLTGLDYGHNEEIRDACRTMYPFK